MARIKAVEVPRVETVVAEVTKAQNKLDRLKDDYEHALKVIAQAKELEATKETTVLEKDKRNQCLKMTWFRCKCGGNPAQCTMASLVTLHTQVLGNPYDWCGDYEKDGFGSCGSEKARKRLDK